MDLASACLIAVIKADDEILGMTGLLSRPAYLVPRCNLVGSPTASFASYVSRRKIVI
jgi:hypothetical protein